MTKHERIILEKLSENPMLSQNELAKMLNLTRSSVSVYISHLMQLGYIRGRGYVLDDQKTVFIVGTSSIDYRTVMDRSSLLQADTATVLDDYDLTVSYGGIAKNLADNMSHLGDKIACISAIGSDVLGHELLNEYKQAGINVDDVLIVPAARSSTYLEIRSLDSSQVIFGSANMKLQLQITPEFLSGKKNKLVHAKMVITEDSISTEALQYLSSNYSPTMLICTKRSRIKRFASFLNQFNGMVASLDIARGILGEPPSPDEDDASVFSLTARLRKKTNGPVLLCYGKNKFSYTGRRHIIICEYTDPLDNAAIYQHYRDTVAASLFHCLLDDIEDEDLLKYVSACRDIVSQSGTLVNHQLCPELVSSVISNKRFQFRYNYIY